jgi:nucleoside triphosphatase
MDNWRIIVVAVIQNSRDEYLICKKPFTRGVFPGQWALPGGGIEPGEQMTAALRREVREEVGLEIQEIKPLFFKDGQHAKLFPDGSSKDIYMIFLLFSCRGCSENVRLGEEFEEYAWVKRDALGDYDLNEQTKDTMFQLGRLAGNR